MTMVLELGALIEEVEGMKDGTTTGRIEGAQIDTMGIMINTMNGMIIL